MTKKPTDSTPIEQLKEAKKIIVLTYDPEWPKNYQDEKEKLIKHLGEQVIDIHHIGSTAIEGMCAKEDLDILLIINKLEHALKLKDCGYVFKGEINIPLRYFFSKNQGKTKVNLHVCEQDHGFINLNLTFRDWLKKNENDKQAYINLKHSILKSPTAGLKMAGGFTQYTHKKDVFIKKILKKSGYSGININFCSHENEWHSAMQLKHMSQANPQRHKALPKKTKDDAQDFLSESKHDDHKHFILYQGYDIIGYAILHLLADKKARIKDIFTDAKKLDTSQDILLRFIKKWSYFHHIALIAQ